MNKFNFTAVLQIALWRNEGLSELEIRQLMADLVSDSTIKAGIGLCDYLNSIKGDKVPVRDKCPQCPQEQPAKWNPIFKSA